MRTENIQIRVSKDFKKRVKKVAEYRNMTVSQLLINAINRDVSDHESIMAGKTQVNFDGK